MKLLVRLSLPSMIDLKIGSHQSQKLRRKKLKNLKMMKTH